MFLIFDWLLLVHKFLQTPSDAKKQPGHATPSRQRSYSSETPAFPNAVKCGIVTKRSSLQISTEKQLEVKINVTGKASGRKGRDTDNVYFFKYLYCSIRSLKNLLF